MGVRSRSGAVGLVLALGGSLISIGSVAAEDTPPAAPTPAEAEEELLYATEGNRLRRFDIDTIGTADVAQDVLVDTAADEPTGGRDVNGEICFLPDGSGRFVLGEDTGQPNPPAGWGIFSPDGAQLAKLTATYFESGAEPHGCEFAPDGALFTSEVGFQGFGTANGQLLMWFDIDSPTPTFCKIATDLGTAGSVTIDHDGRVYVSQSSGLSIERFSPPFPTAATPAGGCGGADSTGAPVADTVQRETFASPGDGMLTFSGLAVAPNGNIYAGSVLTGNIAEYAPDGSLVRMILLTDETALPISTGHPQGLAVGSDGTLYYADLDLRGSLPDVGPGPDGKVRRIRFDLDGEPLDPEIVRDGLAFPDGLGIGPGDLETPEVEIGPWPTHAGGPDRQFFNADEQWLTAESVGRLVERWRFPADAVVTASPSVADVAMTDGSSRRIVFVSSWDGFIYAIDWATGAEVWRFAWDEQPGASFPAAGSTTLATVGQTTLVIVGAGENLYGIDAATGAEEWRFTAGTGCVDPATGLPPGLCGFSGERNQIESTPIVAHNTAYFGMDVNDVATGKGGFYAVDVRDGSLVWYFDVETGMTCRADPSDDIRRFDGYHSEAELGLPTGFLSSRPGCDFDRGPTGCGNVWSSPAYDPIREALYFGTSNCDTDLDPATPAPTPIMPAYDEALVAIGVDGSPLWRWRPREVDNDDLAFGAAPNLFSIEVGGALVDVVGIGGKDGTYYVLDRDGVNETTGRSWNDDSPRDLPYWETNVVPGGAIGGIIATAAVDEDRRRVVFSTAPGFDVFSPQRPTVHALDLDTGAVVWQHAEEVFPAGDASYAPTSAVPGVVIVGSVVSPHLRMFDADDGSLLFDEVVGNSATFSGISSGAAVVDGTIVVGSGIGSRSSGGSSPGDFAADTPADIVALCVQGAPGCPGPLPKVVPGFVEVAEGEGPTTARIPVSLSFPSALEVTASWSVIDVGDLSPGEIVSASGTVVFSPGETETFIDVELDGDELDEVDEIGVVAVGKPVNASMGGYWGLGFVRVIDDDPPPAGRIGNGLAREGDGTLRIPVRLSGISGSDVEMTWEYRKGSAEVGSDLVSAAGSVRIPSGARVGWIEVELVDDATRERLEYAVFELSAADGVEIGRRYGIGLIIDDD
ncbi:MAG: PQQ-binding-like beta-propeller repeat protein [Acidimicrobiales bacterium]